MPILFTEGVTSSVQMVKGGQYLLLGGVDPNGSDAYYGPYIIDSYNLSFEKYRYLEINPRSGQEYIQISSGTSPVTSYVKVSPSFINISTSDLTVDLGTTGTLTLSPTGTSSQINSVFQLTGTVSTTNNTTTTLVSFSTTSNTAYVVWGFLIGEHNTGATAAIGGKVEGVFRNASGTLTSVGVGSTVYEDLFGTPTFTLAVVGTSIALRVTGLTSHTINWYGTLYYMKT